ncbi:unnamed protein product [Haemonchus placei]|uniref:Alpha-galactosidase n=1 Tax=Haemonchus placei TaxID=6290 RepID=A0A158QNV4_HAEPC|nr:unnamed protein product [Haemonchus placei]
MHDRGLELGIYEDYGTKTCEGYPGSLDHLKIDAETFASWDVDYLKLDGCNVNTTLMPTGYPEMERALNATGRPIVYACGWPLFFYLDGKKDKVNYTAVRSACNSWRIYNDVIGNWNSISDIIRFVDANQDVLAAAQAPGGWNDPDMIVAGLPNVTIDQAMVQMTLWSIWSAPLIMSNDLRVLKPEIRDILLNRNVIAIDQDPLGIMGKLVRRIKYISIYVKPVTPVRDGHYSYAVAVDAALMLPIWLAALSVIDTGWSLDNGLARRPPMGWMTWATFLCETNCEMFPHYCISEELFRQMADRIVEDGFLAAGYNRIHIDDCWMERTRNSDGELEADRKRFPNGIKWLARYMHDKKLELGIYADFGTATCMGFPGSIDHLEVDANTFASWDVDYLKMDGCHAGIERMVAGYARMERALNATGRSIIFSCSYPYYFLAQGLKVDLTPTGESCNLWRFYADVEGSWESIAGIIHYVDDLQDTLAAAQRPGAWNDMDMIVAGLGSLTPDQARVQMSLWLVLSLLKPIFMKLNNVGNMDVRAKPILSTRLPISLSIWSSPLIMSNDLRTLSSEFREILQNRDVIAIDQDPLGVMGKLVRKNDSVGIYVKPVTPVINGLTSFAIAVVNMNQVEIKKVRFTFESLGLVNIGGYNLRNLWTGQDFGVVSPTYEYHVELQPTSVSMIKLTIL